MKPIAIFRHSPTEGPGYFAAYLDGKGIPWRLVDAAGGAALPADPRDYAGLTFMGGPMSVNDELPWIAPELALIRRAVAAGVPCLGHCLGGQLMSKALGGAVTRNEDHRRNRGSRGHPRDPSPSALTRSGPAAISGAEHAAVPGGLIATADYPPQGPISSGSVADPGTALGLHARGLGIRLGFRRLRPFQIRSSLSTHNDFRAYPAD